MECGPLVGLHLVAPVRRGCRPVLNTVTDNFRRNFNRHNVLPQFFRQLIKLSLACAYDYHLP